MLVKRKPLELPRDLDGYPAQPRPGGLHGQHLHLAGDIHSRGTISKWPVRYLIGSRLNA